MIETREAPAVTREHPHDPLRNAIRLISLALANQEDATDLLGFCWAYLSGIVGESFDKAWDELAEKAKERRVDPVTGRDLGYMDASERELLQLRLIVKTANMAGMFNPPTQSITPDQLKAQIERRRV